MATIAVHTSALGSMALGSMATNQAASEQVQFRREGRDGTPPLVPESSKNETDIIAVSISDTFVHRNC